MSEVIEWTSEDVTRTAATLKGFAEELEFLASELDSSSQAAASACESFKTEWEPTEEYDQVVGVLGEKNAAMSASLTAHAVALREAADAIASSIERQDASQEEQAGHINDIDTSLTGGGAPEQAQNSSDDGAGAAAAPKTPSTGGIEAPATMPNSASAGGYSI